MKPTHRKTATGMLIILGGALALTLLMLALLAAANQPALAPIIAEAARPSLPVPPDAPAGRPPARPSEQGAVSVQIQVQTSSDPTSGAIIHNGDRVTYTVIVVANESDITIDEIIDDQLPDGLVAPVCLSANCSAITHTQVFTILNPAGGGADDKGEASLITQTVEIIDEISGSGGPLAQGASMTLAYAFRFDSCDADGATIQNRAMVIYNTSGQEWSNYATSIVQADVATGGNGYPFVDHMPAGCSMEPGGAYDQDWGDYDRDGDLDLALATQSGVSVYKNNNGQLARVTNTGRSAFGVRWGDIDNNGWLELVAVGDKWTPPNPKKDYQGINYIYKPNGSDAFGSPTVFTTTEVLWRLALADYKGDTKLEMAAAGYFDPIELGRYPICLLRLFDYSGGTFTPPGTCLIEPLSREWELFGHEHDAITSMAWGDADADGSLDLAVGIQNTFNRLWRGNAAGMLEYVSLWGSASDTRDVVWVDYNLDGRPDLLEVNANAGNPNARSYIFGNGAPLVPVWSSARNDNTSGAWLEDKGRDASIPTSDDRLLQYTLPFTFTYFNRTIHKLCVTTNGLVQLLESGESCADGLASMTYQSTLTPTLDAICARNANLQTGVIIEGLTNPDRVEITWIGTTQPGSFEGSPLQFKVIIFKNEEIEWRFFRMDAGGASFSGLHDGVANETYPIPGASATGTAYRAAPRKTVVSADVSWPTTVRWPVTVRFPIRIADPTEPYTSNPNVCLPHSQNVPLTVSPIPFDDTVSGPSPLVDNRPLTDTVLYTVSAPITCSQPYSGTAIPISATVRINGANVVLDYDVTSISGTVSHQWTGTFTETRNANGVANSALTSPITGSTPLPGPSTVVTLSPASPITFRLRDSYTETTEFDITSLTWDANYWRSIRTADDLCLGDVGSGCQYYPLPFPSGFPYFGQSIASLSLNTNGLIELLQSGESAQENNDWLTHYHLDHIWKGIDAIFAANDDLRTGVVIDHVAGSNMVSIAWIGTTYRDSNYVGRPLLFKVNLFSDGRVQWKFFDMDYSMYSGDLFSGLYHPVFLWLGTELEVPGGSRSFRGKNVNRVFQLIPAESRIEAVSRPSFLVLGRSDSDGERNELYRTNPASRLLETVPTEFNQNDRTWSVAWGDYNQDGFPDLAVGDTNGVLLYRNNQGGLNTNLYDQNFYYPSEAMMSVAWGDINGDGWPDLAVGEWGGLSKLLLNNNGTLTNSTWVPDYSTHVWDVAWGDYDGDTEPDLAMGTDAGAYVSHNNGGELDNAAAWQSPTGDTRAATWADFDKDGDDDLVVGNFNGYIIVHRNRLTFRDPYTTTIRRMGFVNDLAWADYDNDGDQDLAIGGKNLLNPTRTVSGTGGAFVYILRNNSGSLEFKNGAANFATVENDGVASDIPESEAYSLAWGDFNRDGYLDLAAAYPSAKQVRIYRNTGSGFISSTISHSQPPYGVDWADLDGDSRLDLVVAIRNERPWIYYSNSPVGGNFDYDQVERVETTGWFASVRGIDRDNDGDIDVSLANLTGQSKQFNNNAPLLDTSLSTVRSEPARNVAWGDADGDGDQDLLFGGAGSASSQLYYNSSATFSAGPIFSVGGRAIFGDVSGDGVLEVVWGDSGAYQARVYQRSGSSYNSVWSPGGVVYPYDLALGEANGDGQLDLLFAGSKTTARPVHLFLNQVPSQLLATSPIQPISLNENGTSVAWADYNRDNLMDVAVAHWGQPTRVYRNNGDNTFNSAWSTPGGNATSVAWADYNSDGWLDLAVGYDGAPNRIYGNSGSSFALAWTAPVTLSTNSLAWGDWNNDGKPDLAVGNNGSDQVYANRSIGSEARFLWLWTSGDTSNVTGLAWGDVDNDGDLDLAISRNNGQSGVYKNNYVLSAHLSDDVAEQRRNMPLPHNPSYLYIARPGTADAYFCSSWALTSPTVTIGFKVYDPDGPRNASNPPGDSVFVLLPTGYEYLTNMAGSDGTWQPVQNWMTTYAGETLRRGQWGNLVWDVEADGVVNDDVRFRIGVIHNNRVGPVQRASTRAVSPPFRLLPLTCEWPDGPSIAMAPGDTVPVSSTVVFTGGFTSGTGVLTLTWSFGDGSTAVGHTMSHVYTTSGVYSVTLTIVGEPCPTIREVATTRPITVGFVPRPGGSGIYLPIILKSGVGAGAVGVPTVPGVPVPIQVTGLTGRMGTGATMLRWSPNPPADKVLGYHIYRSPREEVPSFELLATVPATVTTYTDNVSCGHMYYLTAFNAGGESPASTSSYVSRRCR